jgi:protein-S-isoprenylcysteine O-methyltransferase Ste14
MKVISKFTLLLVLVAILFLLLTGNLFSLSPIVIAIQILSLALSIWARKSFQPGQFSIHAEPKEGGLLHRGPYQFIRHPMYAAALLIIWSGVIGHYSPINLAVALIVTTAVAIRIVVEEQGLRIQYPDYAEYTHSTKRIIPKVI